METSVQCLTKFTMKVFVNTTYFYRNDLVWLGFSMVVADKCLFFFEQLVVCWNLYQGPGTSSQSRWLRLDNQRFLIVLMEPFSTNRRVSVSTIWTIPVSAVLCFMIIKIKNSLPRKLNSVCFLVICNPFNDYCYNVHFTCDGDRFTLVSYSDWYLCGHCQYVTAFSETHCSTNETDNTNFSRPTRPYNETSWV